MEKKRMTGALKMGGTALTVLFLITLVFFTGCSRMKNVVQVDCAVHRDSDPNPNDPEIVRDAFAGSGIAVKVRGPAALESWYKILPRVVHPSLRLIVQLTAPENPEKASQEYDALNRFLADLY